MIFWLLRHCETTGQEPDAPLTEAGERAAKALVPTLAALGVEKIVSSPYTRACATVAPLAATGLPLETDDRLAEWRLSGTQSEAWPEMLTACFADPALSHPGGETAATALTRALQSIHAHADKAPTLFVSHGALLTLILSRFGLSASLDTLKSLGTPGLFRVEGSTATSLPLDGLP